jgi:hypothetical protein
MIFDELSGTTTIHHGLHILHKRAQKWVNNYNDVRSIFFSKTELYMIVQTCHDCLILDE